MGKKLLINRRLNATDFPDSDWMQEYYLDTACFHVAFLTL